MIRHGLVRLGMVVALALGPVPVQAAVTVGGNPDAALTSEVNDDAFAGGESVSIAAPVRGELFAAGSTVTVSTRPDRSVFALGMTVNVPNGAGYDAFVGGQTVTLAGEYGHDVYAIGQTVVLEPNTHVNGSLYVMGGSITLHGRIDGQLSVAGETVTSDAAVGRDARLSAGGLKFTGGSVGGALRYSSSAAVSGLDTVSVAGQTIKDDEPKQEPTIGGDRSSAAATILDALMALLTMVAVGALMILLFPARLATVSQAVLQGWGGSFLTGLVAFVVGPMVIGLALATLIGWPVALVVGFLYVTTVIASAFVAPIVLGQLVVKVEKGDRPWRALLLGVAIVAVTTTLPIVGWVASLAVFVGLTLPVFGASLRWVWKELRG